jgi:hypothetical protein
VRPARPRCLGGEAGQTMPLVLGIILLLSLGTFMLTQDTFQQFPIVTKDVIEHEAYRAMESGLNEYLYAVNADADFAACNATFVTGGSSTASTLTSASSVCAGLSFGTWTAVPGSSSTNGPPAYFLIDNPSINTTTGLLSIDIVGSAGYTNDYNYQTAVVTLQPLNSFLLNVLWINYDQVDPTVVEQYNGHDPTCGYYYDVGLEANCESIEFVAADTLTGNLFLNDSVFVCGSPNFQTVETADDTQDYVDLCASSLTSSLHSGTNYTSLSVNAIGFSVSTGDSILLTSGTHTQTVTASANEASGSTTIAVNSFTANYSYPTSGGGTSVSDTPTVTGTWTDDVTAEPLPADDASLVQVAKTGGCYYEGPTTIVLTGTTMNVTSYGTPTGLPSGATGGSSNDSLNDPANTANVCINKANPYGGSVALPANGVIYVGTCTNQGNGCNNDGGDPQSEINPLSGAGETGLSGDTQGDAIIQGSLSSPVTIGTANNIVIDGNLCYTDTMASGKCTTNSPQVPSTDVLGLVADNFVEINHPVSGGNDASLCGSNPYTSPTSGAVNCDLENPIIDAIPLALTHSFIVNNYTTGNGLGTLNVFGSIDEDWRGPVGTVSGGSVATGYAKNYQYDQRLIYLSPPYYLNPGTSQWGFASFTDSAGNCKTPSGAYPSACTGYP